MCGGDEIWRPVPSLPGVMASSHGRVLLPPSTAQMPNGGERKYVPKPTLGTITKSKATARHTYRNIFNRKLGNLKVHRLVCEAFHGPCPPGMETMHRDENGLNNRPENLEWGTRKDNLNAPGFIEYCKSRTGHNNPRVKGMNKNVSTAQRQD